MRAKSVYESADFKRGLDPKDTMGIGAKLYIWDKFLSLRERERGDWMTYYAIYTSESDRSMRIYGQGPKFKSNTNRILKEMGLDEYLELPGKITERGSNYNGIIYPVKPQYWEMLKDFQSSDYFGKKSVFESLKFNRGKDPKSAMDIGLSNVIYNKWDELQSESGIGSINIEKSLNSVWHLVVYVGQFPGSGSEGFNKVQKYFADYLSPFYNKKGGEIKIKILPEYVQAFIDAYNMRYPAWTISEGIDFQRSYSKGDIIDRLTDNLFRSGRLFVYKRRYFDNSHKVLAYIGEDEFEGAAGIFQTVGVFMNLKKGTSYAFYAPGLLYGSDKRTLLAKETVRPLNKEEIELYLERKNNPSEKFIKHLEEVKKIIGVEPFI